MIFEKSTNRAEHDIDAYPNPVSDILHIRKADDRYNVDRFEIIDYIGMVVWKEGNSAEEITNNTFYLDVSGLKREHYTLRVYSSNNEVLFNHPIIKS